MHILAVGLAAWYCARLVQNYLPLSSVSIAIVFGIIVRFFLGDRLPGGVKEWAGLILKVGIVLMGFRLSLVAVGQIGIVAIPLVLICISTALLVAWCLTKMWQVPAKLGALIAIGTSICGVTAVIATSPAIGASDDETSYAVASVSIFGLVALLTYPFLAHYLFASDFVASGYFLGTSIHDTAQVMGAGMTFQDLYDGSVALDTAAVTKLIRNSMMAFLIPAFAWQFGKQGSSGKISWQKAIPGFVIGFILMAALRSLGDAFDFGQVLYWGDIDLWSSFVATTKHVSKMCFTLALAGIGLSTSLTKIVKIGLVPFVVALVTALAVGLVSASMIAIWVV